MVAGPPETGDIGPPPPGAFWASAAPANHSEQTRASVRRIMGAVLNGNIHLGKSSEMLYMVGVNQQDAARLPMDRKTARSLGLPTYPMERPCKRGHVGERITSSGSCVQCVKQWDAANRESRLVKMREKYRTNSEFREKLAGWGKRNPELKRESLRKWQRANPEKRYKWRNENHERSLAITRNRRAKQKAVGGIHSEKDIERILAAQKKKCAVCCQRISDRHHVDHIIPIARGGSNHPRNLQILCAPCNQSKGAKDPIDFMQTRGFLM